MSLYQLFEIEPGLSRLHVYGKVHITTLHMSKSVGPLQEAGKNMPIPYVTMSFEPCLYLQRRVSYRDSTHSIRRLGLRHQMHDGWWLNPKCPVCRLASLIAMPRRVFPYAREICTMLSLEMHSQSTPYLLSWVVFWSIMGLAPDLCDLFLPFFE